MRATMEAVVCTAYGPPEVLQLREVPRPSPRGDELLVRVHAAAVTMSDCYMRSGVPEARLFLRAMLRVAVGVRRPRRVLGMALVGEIVETGTRVTSFRRGDRVFAFTSLRSGA